MALPKRRQSTRRKGKRRAALKLKRPTLVACPECSRLKKPHQVCPNCGSYSGSYKGKELIKQKIRKKEK